MTIESLATVKPGFDRASRSRLTHRDLPRFPSESLFDRIARTVCLAECLPRKELYESWEVARRVRRRYRGGRIVDFASGHGLLAHMMLLLDDSSPSAVAVDTRLPASAPKIAEALAAEWPRLAGRVSLKECALETFAVLEGDLVVSAHACGDLTDEILRKAIGARARVAVLPCCQDERTCDVGSLGPWLDSSLAIDVTRVGTLRNAGYDVHTHAIPAAITPKNRLIFAAPCAK